MTIAAGAKLGPYEILAPLGAGGMGEVFRARDTRLAREVAIKVLPAAVASDPERLKRFEKEARSASALNHPSIVTIYDIGQTDGVSWIAMELVDGKTLRELLVSGALPVKRLLLLATSVAEGLAKAHEAGIVHRDLKPENVMVTKDGLVKILDFGLAKLSSTGSGSGEGSQLPTMTGTTPGVVVGTVGYMSPEQASGEALDFRSDQFSFGSVLYELATGKRAFQKKTAIDTLGAILNTEPEPIAQLNPQVPAPLRWIAERCLSKEPDHRYASTKDLARELATVRDHLSETSGITEVAPAGRKRFRLVPAVLSAAALAFAVLATKLLWKAPAQAFPRFQQLTFREEAIATARFAPDGQTIVYGVVREGRPFELFSTRVGSLESRSMGLNANICAISSTGEMALVLGGPNMIGTLAQAPLAGGAPREILEGVAGAAWAPDGKSLAVGHRVGGKWRLEFPVGTVLSEKTGFIGGLHFSREGDRLLFWNGGALSILELKTKKVRALREASEATSYGWSPRGDEIWMTVVSGATTELRAFKPGGPARLMATLPGTFVVHDTEPRGRLLVERVAQRAEMLALAPGETRERNLSWLDGSLPMDISADGKTVLFNETGTVGKGFVYLRKTDGSDAVRLGEGWSLALSPDAKWALVGLSETEAILMPTGAGEPRRISAKGVEFGSGTFFPDGKRVLLEGTAAGVRRLYVRDLDGEGLYAVGSESIRLPNGGHTISPDGKLVVARDVKGTWSLYSLEAGEPALPRPILGMQPGDEPIRWSADGRQLFVFAQSGALLRLDPATGHRELVKQLPPGSTAQITPDGSAYVYGYGYSSSHLMLIEGLK